MALKMGAVKRRLLLDRLAAKGVTMLKSVTYREVVGGRVVLSTNEGESKTIEPDTIVVAGERRPDVELLKALEGKVARVCLVGDCVEPRGILEAIHEGYATGFRL